MGAIKVPYYVEKPNKDGTVRRYWQPSAKLAKLGWPPEALPDDEGLALQRARAINDQLAAWRKGTAAAPIAAPGGTAAPASTKRYATVGWLIADYKAGRFFRPLAEKTKYEYGMILRHIEDWAGDMLVRALTPKLCEEWYTAMYELTPTYANTHMRVLHRLLKWGIKAEVISSNAADSPGLMGVPLTGKIWPAHATAFMIEVADRLGYHGLGDAIALNDWVGQRKEDLLRLTKTIYRNGKIYWQQGKRGAFVQLPVDMVTVLGERLEASRRRHELATVTATTLLVDDLTGQAFTADRFDAQFEAVRNAAAAQWSAFEVDYLVAGREPDAPDAMIVYLHELTFMYFRHTAVTTLAECGATNDEIRAITGHSEQTIVAIKKRYVVVTGKMAEQAFAKRLARDAAQGGVGHNKGPASAGGGQ